MATLMCSAAMGLPVSSFPNMNALGLEDQTGKPWLTPKDFIRSGVVCSVAAYLCLMLIAYPLMLVLQFR
jgi:phosphate transporter